MNKKSKKNKFLSNSIKDSHYFFANLIFFQKIFLSLQAKQAILGGFFSHALC